jgi:hypothetical protein
MSRRIPDCAWCGKTLRRGPVVRLHFEALPGKPEIGWHLGANEPWRCAIHDPIASVLCGGGRHKDAEMDGDSRATIYVDETPDLREIKGHIRTIQTRGESRVSANKAWREDIRKEQEHADVTRNKLNKGKTFLKFECGARLPAKGYLREPYTPHAIKEGSKQRKDGRVRLVVYDSECGLTRPMMPDGDPAPCLYQCPAKRKSGRQRQRCFPSDDTKQTGKYCDWKWRWIVTCYPEEIDDGRR